MTTIQEWMNLPSSDFHPSYFSKFPFFTPNTKITYTQKKNLASMSFFSSIQLLNSIFAYTQVCLISFFASIQLLNSIFYPKIKILPSHNFYPNNKFTFISLFSSIQVL